jgi:hypothetical protein
MLVEFLAQGMHFARGHGKDFCPEPETISLDEMYNHRPDKTTLTAFVKQVRMLKLLLQDETLNWSYNMFLLD